MACNEAVQRNNMYSQPDENGLQLLHYAAQYGLARIVEILITTFECQPDCRGVGNPVAGITPLHLASANGHLEVVRKLLDNGSDPFCTVQGSYNAFHVACVYGHIEIVRELISKKPLCPLEEDNKGVTLLHIACRFGHPSIVHYLITEMRCIPRYDVTQNQGFSPLHCACMGGNLKVVKEVAKCMTVWYPSKTVSGTTPLHLACRGGHTETVKYLVSEMKCNTTIQDRNDFYPVHYACFQKEYYQPHMPHIENSEQEVSSQGSQGSSQYLDIIQFLENKIKVF